MLNLATWTFERLRRNREASETLKVSLQLVKETVLRPSPTTRTVTPSVPWQGVLSPRGVEAYERWQET